MSIKQIDGYKIYLNKKLGEGSYGAVYIGINDSTHENVAVKILKKLSSNFDLICSRLGRLPQECTLLRNQNHAERQVIKHRRFL